MDLWRAPGDVLTGERRGLAPFDEPVYLEEPDGPELASAPSDQQPRPVAAFLCRACVLATVAGVAPFLTDRDIRVLVLVLAAINLPVTTALDLRAGSGGRRSLTTPLVALDIGVLTALASFTGRHELLSGVGLVAIAFHRWLYGRRPAAVSVVLVTAGLGALAQKGGDEVDWFSVGVVAAAGSLVAWLVDDQASRHSRATEGLHLVATRAEAVLEGIGDAIVSTDGSCRIVGMNPAAMHLLGCTASDVRGAPCQQILGLECDGARGDCGGSCGLLEHDGRSVEVRRRQANGDRQPLLASAVALRNQEGEIVEVVHLLRDITSLKQADDAKTMFLATASHELKTPLAVISGYAQVLRMNQFDHDDRNDALVAIEARATQLGNIVDRLLMSSRIDAGRIELDSRTIPVDDLLRDHARSFSASSRKVELTIEDDLPVAVADHDALETVVDHLLDNARKYSPDRSPIGLSARSEDDHVIIEVRDAGIGMSREQMDLCFERFWQAEGTDVRRFGGTGIGLYIVQSLVHAMDGTITVRANDGPGVTFSVRLRRRPVDRDAVPPQEDAATPPREGEPSMIREFMRQVGVLSEPGDPA